MVDPGEVRIDALPTSRHVLVRIDGEVVADSMRASRIGGAGRARVLLRRAGRHVIVPPTGVAERKTALLERFHPANGAMPGVRLEIRNATSVRRTPGIEVVRYEEWQIHPQAGNQRISTAVFVANPDAPLGWSWLALHETALPG